MRKESISMAVGNIRQNYILEAAEFEAPTKNNRTVWIMLGTMAACFCFILSGLMIRHSYPSVPPIVNSNPVASLPHRGDPGSSYDDTQPSTPVETGEKIHIYKISSLDIDTETIAQIQKNLAAAGWSETQSTLIDEYSFVLKGSTLGEPHALRTEECLEMATAFLNDSGLAVLMEPLKMEYELDSEDADTLTVAYCYFVCNGARTGSYIRFIFEDYKHIGEVQAYLYSSTYADSLPLLTLNEALKKAKKLDADGNLIAVDASNYSIKNTQLIYIEGLPYYQFDGYGIHIREFINGYALAVDITASDIGKSFTSPNS